MQQTHSKQKKIVKADCVNNMTIDHITSACPILTKEQYTQCI